MVIFEFKKVHSGCRVEDGSLRGKLEARTMSTAIFQRRKAELVW